MKLLALESATESCSVALLDAGRMLLREAPRGTAHSGSLLQLVTGLLAEAGTGISALDAIAFGRGPGAFTGVRLAASVTQGLAYAAGLPVIPVSSLQAVAQQVLGQDPSARHVLVCQDARLQEVYWAAFDAAVGWAVPAGAEQVGAAGSVGWPEVWGTTPALVAAGSALGILPALDERLAGIAAALHPGLLPHAREVAQLAARAGLAAAVSPVEALPVYLRNDVAQPALSRGCNVGSAGWER